MPRRTIQGRFDEKVRVEPNGCHIWTGAKNSGGYGQLRIGEKRIQAHRLVYLFATGRLHKSSKVIQTCGHRDCVNLDHLRLKGT